MLYSVGGYIFDVYKNENGYYVDIESNEFVHRIIAMDKFNLDSLYPWQVVHHIDGDKLNNNPKNLYICYWEFHDLIHRNRISKQSFWKFVYKMKSMQAHK